ISYGASFLLQRVANVSRVGFVRVGEIGGAHEAVAAYTDLTREVVEHEDALTDAVGADLEPSAIGRKRILTSGPCASVIGRRGVGVMLAVIEDHLEMPSVASVKCAGIRRFGPRGVVLQRREIGRTIAVADSL